MNKNIQPPHVVIIGAGFGGLRAAQALAKTAVQITLIDRLQLSSLSAALIPGGDSRFISR